MKSALVILLSVALYGSSTAQTKTTGDAKSGAQCSPAVTGSGNTFYYEYCGTDPEEGKRILRLLKAVAHGEVLTNDKLDKILDILLTPPKITKSASFAVAAPPGAHPRAAINFMTDDPIERGQFEVVCDRACSPVDVCRLMGSNTTIFGIVSDHEDIVEFLFQRQFPPLTQCQLTVESRDDKPVSIIGLATSRRITNVVRSAVQPDHCVIAGGGSSLC
jgi:hypothetical protein